MEFGNTGVYADGNEEIEDEIEDAPIPKRARIYESCGLHTRKSEVNELGFPSSRANCFGCVFIGESDAGAIQYEEITGLMNMIRKTIARTDIINLAKYVSKAYTKIKRDINNNLLLHEAPLPDWSPASVLDHIRHHNTDPEIQAWIRLTELQELIQIGLQSSVEKDEITGDVRLEEKQTKLTMELMKLHESIAKSNPAKKLFYSKSKHIDIDASSSGLIASGGKNIIDYYKNKRKRN